VIVSLTPSEEFVSYIMVIIKLHIDEMMTISALYQINTLSWIFILLACWNNSPWV